MAWYIATSAWCSRSLAVVGWPGVVTAMPMLAAGQTGSPLTATGSCIPAMRRAATALALSVVPAGPPPAKDHHVRS